MGFSRQQRLLSGFGTFFFCGKHDKIEKSRLPVASWGSWNPHASDVSRIYFAGCVRCIDVAYDCTTTELLQNHKDSETLRPKYAKAILGKQA